MKALDKMTKVELITLISERNEELKVLRARLSVRNAPRAPQPYFVPPEVVEAYFAAHPNVKSQVVPKDMLLAWAASEGLR